MAITSSINLISPTTLYSGTLIADKTYDITTNGPYATSQSLEPTLTQIGGKPIAAAFEIQSTLGGFVPPRMTDVQVAALITNIPQRPLAVSTFLYNLTDDRFEYYNGTDFIPFAGGAGGNVTSVSIPAIDGDIAVYDGVTGVQIRDSTVNIAAVAPILDYVGVLNVTGPYLTNFGYLGFNDDVAPIVVNGLTGVTFINNSVTMPAPANITCAVFSGGSVPSGSDSVNAILEVQSTEGALLLSRLTDVQIGGMQSPAAGMILFAADREGFAGFDATNDWTLFLRGGTSLINTTLQFPQLVIDASGFISGASSLGNYNVSDANLVINATGSALGIGGSNNLGFGLNLGATLTTGSANVLIGNFTDVATGITGSSVAIGYQTKTYNSSVAIGYGAQVTAINSVAVGYGTTAAQNAVALGYLASAPFDGSIAIGQGVTTTVTGQILLGTDSRFVTMAGGQSVRVNARTANYTPSNGDYLIACDSTSSPFTVTLHAASTVAGQSYIIKDVAGMAATNNITLSSSSGFDGLGTSIVINTNYASITVISNGTKWMIV